MSEMNILKRAYLEVMGELPERGEQWPRETTDEPFGPRQVDLDGESHPQWLYGANRMTDMACKASDDLAWWYEGEDDQYVVRNSRYDMERQEDSLWRAMWILERDIRVEHGTKWHSVDERGELPTTPEHQEDKK